MDDDIGWQAKLLELIHIDIQRCLDPLLATEVVMRDDTMFEHAESALQTEGALRTFEEALHAIGVHVSEPHRVGRSWC